MPIVVAIDGPAGSGKGTVTRALAEALGLPYLDTGSLYRGVGICVIAKGCSLEDPEACETIARSLCIEIPGPGKLLIDGQDVSISIRSPIASDAASRVSVHPGVRDALINLQRQIASQHGAVVEGRDTTTVVFPEATLKIYLTADVVERAKRVAGSDEYLDVLAMIQERDHRDSTRAIAPLKQANDAVMINSTDLSVEEVVERILGYLKQRVSSLRIGESQ